MSKSIGILAIVFVACCTVESHAPSNVYAQDQHSAAEPDLGLSFSPEPPYLRRNDSTNLEIDVKYGAGVLPDQQPVLKFDENVLNVSFTDTGRTKLKIAVHPSAVNTKSVSYVTLTVFGINGRSNARKFPVFVNAGAVVGEIRPAALTAGKTETATLQLGDVSYSGNRFEGSVFFNDVNSDGARSENEPSIVVDANNRFRFPEKFDFFYEHIIRPKKLWVDGNDVPESAFGDFLVDPKLTWFGVAAPVNEPELNRARNRLRIRRTPVAPAPVAPALEAPAPAKVKSSPPAAAEAPPMAANAAAAEAEPNQADHALRVKAGSTQAVQDGTTWDTAFPTLDAALANVGGDRMSVWIAQGVYRQPKPAAGRPTGFQIPNGVSLYGGFLGDPKEKRLEDRPRLRRGTTILTGDVGADDGHFAPVTAVATTPDGSFVVSAGADRNIKVWKKNGATYALHRTLFGHTQGVNSVAITDDGSHVVSGGDDMTIRIWGLSDADPEGIVAESGAAPVGVIRSVCFSHGGHQFAAAGADGIVRSFVTLSPKTGTAGKENAGEMTSVTFIDNGKIATGGVDGAIRIWVASTGDSVQVLEGHAGPVTSLVTIPGPGSDPVIISAGEDSSIRMWGKPKASDPFQQTFSFSGENYELRLPTITALTELPQEGRGLAVLAKFGENLELRVFNGRGEQSIQQTFAGADATSLSGAVGTLWSATQLSSTDRAAIVEVLSPLIGDRPLRDDFGPIKSLAIAPDGRTVVASHSAKLGTGMGNTLSCWSLETGRLSFATKVNGDDFLAAIAAARSDAVNNNGSLIMGGRQDGGISILDWKAADRQFKDTPSVTSAAISADGKLTASGRENGTIVIGNEDGSAPITIDLATTPGNGLPVKGVGFNPVAAQLAFATKNILFAPAIQMAPDLSKTASHDGNVTCIAFSDDGKQIATGDDAGVVYVWKPDDLTSVRRFAGHVGPVTCIDIVGKDGACRILSGSTDRTVRVWDLAENRLDDTIRYNAPIISCSATGVLDDIRVVVSVDRVVFKPVNLTASTPIALTGHQAVDGRTTMDGDRVLVVAQVNAVENGIYDAAAGAWRRSTDADEADEFLRGKMVLPREGTFANRRLIYSGTNRAVPGTDALAFTADFAPVRLKSDVNIPLPLSGTPSIDSVQTVATNRVLLTAQSDPKDNGIYEVKSAAWTRAEDADADGDFVTGKLVSVTDGMRYRGALENYEGPNSPSVNTDLLLFAPRIDRPVVDVLRWTKELGVPPQRSRVADLATVDVMAHVAIAGDGRTVAGSGASGTLRIWRANALGELSLFKSISAHAEDLTAVGVNQAGNQVLSAGNKDLIVWRDSAKPITRPEFAPFAAEGADLDVGTQKDNAASVVVVVDDVTPDPVTGNIKNVTIEWLTIQGGVQTTGSGAGLSVNKHKNVTVRNCIVEGNAAQSGSGASIGKDGSVQFVGELFAWNTAKTAGGGAAVAGAASFQSCIFHENQAATTGGGVDVTTDATSVLIEKCTIHHNQSAHGSAIYIAPSAIQPAQGNRFNINNSTITSNHTSAADGYALESGDDQRIVLQNSIVATNVRGDGGPADAKCALAPEAATNLFGGNIDIKNANEVIILSTQDDTEAPWRKIQNAAGKLNYFFISSTESPLPLDLFDGFGDFGGVHPTIGLSSISFARERGSDPTSSRYDQRGLRYLGTYVMPDIGAFEWQPLPAALPDDYVLLDPDQSMEINPIENDGSPTISGIPSIVTDSVSASIGTLTPSDGGLTYKLKDDFKTWLGRDEVQYLAEFGGRTSEPGRSAVWIVGKSAGPNTFVVTTEHDQAIPATGAIDFGEGGLTLREAITLASYSAGNDEIRFATETFASPREIKLVAPLDFGPRSNGELKIVGPGAELLTLVGPGPEVNGSRPFCGFEVRSVKSLVPLVTISHLTLRDFTVPEKESGAGIRVRGDSEVRIEHVGFVNNSAAVGGSALVTGESSGVVILSQCTFRGNLSGAPDGPTVRSTGKIPVQVSESVFWENLSNGIAENDSIYDSTNFVAAPRWMSREADEIRLRRDSLAFRPGDLAAGTAPVPKGAYAPRFGDDGRRIFPHEAAYATGKSLGQSIIFVDHSATSGGDGSSPATAYRTLDEALERAAVDYSVAEVRVAGGTGVVHSPKFGYDWPRTDVGTLNTFVLQHGLKLTGGYPSISERDTEGNRPPADVSDPASFPTTLHGLLNGGGSTEVHSECVMTARGITAFQVENLTIRGGSAPEQGAGTAPGGGAFRGSDNSIGKLTGLTLVENNAHAGGAIYLAAGDLQIDRCLFQKNQAVLAADGNGGRGGAIYLADSNSKLTIKNSSFTENVAGNAGGAAIHFSNGTLTGDYLTIFNNTAGVTGGAGIRVDAGTQAITNSIVAQNTPTDVVGADLSAANVVTPTWNPLFPLLAMPAFNPYQAIEGGAGGFAKTVRQGPTQSLAILPQIAFRRSSSGQTLVDQANAASTEAGDQIGVNRRPSPTAGLRDVGAFERQYFKGTNDFPRFFVVDDVQTGRHLWAETAANLFVQVSQHREAAMPAVKAVSDESIEFTAGDHTYTATKQTGGFVKLSTPFPSDSDSLLNVDYQAKSGIRLELETVGGVDRLTVKVPTGDPPQQRWRITPPSGSNIESTDAEFVVNPVVLGKYTVELVRASKPEKITVQVRPHP